MNTKNKYNSRTYSLKVFGLFFLVIVLILSIIWAMVLPLYSGQIVQSKVNEVQTNGDEIASLFGTENFEKEVVKISSSAGMQVLIFAYYNKNLDLDSRIISCSPFYPTNANVNVTLNDETLDMIKTSELNLRANNYKSSCDIYDVSAAFGQETQSNNIIIYYAVLDIYGLEYFMYATKPLYADNTMSTITEFLAISTAVSFTLCVLLCILLSKEIVSPIKNMSKKANALLDGDFLVHFDGNGSNEIDVLAEALNTATNQMSQTQGLRQDVIANVSHDLKTPLTLIKSYAEMLKDFPNAPQNKKEERLDLIISETDRLTALVNQMLKLSQTESGVVPLKKTVFDLSELTSKVIKIYSVKENEGFNFDVDVTEKLFVLADKLQIEQVIHNYLTNAIKYTGKDKHIKITLKRVNDVARFDVFDTGKGISDEDRIKIWDRYYRASKQYTRGAGNGLGLSIVKNILTRHEFKYGVNSVMNKGSDFFFEIPLTQEETL